MPAAGSYSLGLSLTGPLVLNVLTAPTERIKLFLQTQDEIILNLRQESLTQQQHQHHNQHHHQDQQHQQSTAGACPFSTESTPLPSQPCESDNSESKSHDDQTTRNESNEVEQVVDNKNDKDKLENDDEEEDEEPRSIIVPYAQLPYKDMQDCFQRLIEKEGWQSLWRGYPLE